MYVKSIWHDGDVITEAKMNNIEDGIEMIDNVKIDIDDFEAELQEFKMDVAADINDFKTEVNNKIDAYGLTIVNNEICMEV